MTDVEAPVSAAVDGFPTAHPDEDRSQRARAPGLFWVVAGTLVFATALTLLVPRGDAGTTVGGRGPAPATANTVATVSASAGIGAASKATANDGLMASVNARRSAVEQNPRDREAWSELVGLHDRAGQAREAVTALNTLQALDPQVERQRELVRRYAALGDERELIRVLGTLVNGMQAGNAADHHRLAKLLIASGAAEGAAQTLDALRAREPTSYGAEALNLHVQALLAHAPRDASNPSASLSESQKRQAVDRASQLVKQWLATGPAPDEAAAATAELSRAGHHDRVATLLEPMLSARSPAVVSAWTQAMKLSGQQDLALRRLASLSGSAGDARGVAPVIAQRVALALDAGKLDIAIEAARSVGWTKLEGDVAARLVDALLATSPGHARTQRLSARHDAVLRELWIQGAQPALGQHNPLLAARAALVLSDHAAAARWSDAATAACDTSPSCAVRLAQLHQWQGRTKEAAAALKWVDESRVDMDDALLVDYARAAMAAGQAREGFARLDRQRKATTSKAFDAAWALLATGTGRTDEVARWLESDAQVELPADVTAELFKLALDSRANAVAVALSKRMNVDALRPAQRAMLAQALLEMGRWNDSMIHWQAARKAGGDYEEAYAKALDQAVQRGAGGAIETEWSERMGARIASSKVGKEREALVQQLVDRQAYDKALPWLETLAAAQPKRWLKDLETAATKSGQPERANAVWRKVASHDSLNATDRLRIGWALFDGGDKEAGDHVLRLALVEADPDDPSLQRLYAHWGPRFAPDQLDWVEARALTVGLRNQRPGPEQSQARAAWMRRLNEAGGAARTVTVYKRLQPRPSQGPEFEAYVEALTRLGDRASLAQALRSATTRTP